LDIDIDIVKQKFIAVLTQRGLSDPELATYDDMAGPIFVVVAFCIILMGKGKLEAGNIYGFVLFGSIGIYLMINLMSKRGQYIEWYSCLSNLGYGLLPFCILASISLFTTLHNHIGWILSALTVLWSTITAARLFEYSLDM
jgi:hypothetical protein